MMPVGLRSVTDKQTTTLLLIATVPALLVGILFELFLGHRHDYSGHYAAGYGGTLAASVFCIGLIPGERFMNWSGLLPVPLCLACILLGAFFEATVFRLAKFDEIDLFNQSIGAVLAAICVVAYTGRKKPTAGSFLFGMIAGICFLGAGGILAFA